ncbi:hypothetical protein C8R47DRAFT_1235680 [Mycena vitilis]|nr:hypothetical protein C8R47DRAFT_1235680 [Mycena vitilis]
MVLHVPADRRDARRHLLARTTAHDPATTNTDAAGITRRPWSLVFERALWAPTLTLTFATTFEDGAARLSGQMDGIRLLREMSVVHVHSRGAVVCVRPVLVPNNDEQAVRRDAHAAHAEPAVLVAAVPREPRFGVGDRRGRRRQWWSNQSSIPPLHAHQLCATTLYIVIPDVQADSTPAHTLNIIADQFNALWMVVRSGRAAPCRCLRESHREQEQRPCFTMIADSVAGTSQKRTRFLLWKRVCVCSSFNDGGYEAVVAEIEYSDSKSTITCLPGSLPVLLKSHAKEEARSMKKMPTPWCKVGAESNSPTLQASSLTYGLFEAFWDHQNSPSIPAKIHKQAETCKNEPNKRA